MGRSKTIPCHFHAGKHERGVCPRAGSPNTQMLIFHCCLLITVLTQDKGHQATALSTHERKLQEHSLFIFSTRIVSKRVSRPSEFNIRNKQECHNATNIPGTASSYKHQTHHGGGCRVHTSCLRGQSGSEGLTTQPSSTKTCCQQREAGVHPTNLDAASLLIASLPAPKLQAAAPLSASEVFECIARNIQSVKIWIWLLSWLRVRSSIRQLQKLRADLIAASWSCLVKPPLPFAAALFWHCPSQWRPDDKPQKLCWAGLRCSFPCRVLHEHHWRSRHGPCGVEQCISEPSVGKSYPKNRTDAITQNRHLINR